MPEYYIGAINYLDRAKTVFDMRQHQTWFYTAFEIRCGIEARLREYLKHQEHVSEKKKKGWRPAVLAKDIEKVFKIGEKEAVFTLVANGIEPITLVYKPVTKQLQDVASKLGNYLHAPVDTFFENAEYWSDFERLIQTGIEGLEYCTSGSLLGVPLRKTATNQMVIYASVDPEVREQMNALLQTGLVNINVDYRELR